MYIRIALERPGHYPGKVRQAWQIGKDWKLRKPLQTGTDSTGTEELCSLGKAAWPGEGRANVDKKGLCRKGGV